MYQKVLGKCSEYVDLLGQEHDGSRQHFQVEIEFYKTILDPWVSRRSVAVSVIIHVRKICSESVAALDITSILEQCPHA